MKPSKHSLLFAYIAAIATILIGMQSTSADGIPEPGLLMYGRIYNLSANNTLITTGSLQCTITPANGGAPVVVTAPLQVLPGGYSYRLRVPFETVLGSTIASPGQSFATTAANSSYHRTLLLIINDRTISPRDLAADFQFKVDDHAKVEELNLYFEAGILPQSVSQFSDLDGDGISDADEIRAGTNPQDPKDFLHFTQILNYPRQGILLEWTSAAGRQYSLLRSEGAINAPFQLLQGGLLATPPINAFLDKTATNAGPYFYRVTVK